MYILFHAISHSKKNEIYVNFMEYLPYRPYIAHNKNQVPR